MTSRQEHRNAERNAAKRAPAKAGTAGAAGAANAAGAPRSQNAAGAAAALANLNVNLPGDWTTQAAGALGDSIVKRRAAQGDREALFSWGIRVMSEAPGVVGAPLPMGAGGRSPKAEAGFKRHTLKLPVDH
jgi:hypothetical protein